MQAGAATAAATNSAYDGKNTDKKDPPHYIVVDDMAGGQSVVAGEEGYGKCIITSLGRYSSRPTN